MRLIFTAKKGVRVNGISEITAGYCDQIARIYKFAKHSLLSIKPSVWVERNWTLTPDISPLPGKLSYRNSPYTREIIDCLAPDHPARVVAIMKGAQIGFSRTVIEGGIGWIIDQQPGNIMYMVGHEELLQPSVGKIDRMLDSTGIRKLIKSNSGRATGRKTGDTDKMKEFPNGSLKIGITNHKSLRNLSIQYAFIDDFESMSGSSEKAGDTTALIEQRLAAYASKMKLFYISTPEARSTSNIEPVYLLGDQRKFHIPCPCCGVYIDLKWECDRVGDTIEKAGITWQLDVDGELIGDSVGYTCQECGGFFDDRQKMDWLNAGQWVPTTKSKRPGYFSYHISSLYAPTYMYGWEHYVRQYLLANPKDGNVDAAKMKTFVNVVLGETWEEQKVELKASTLQANQRDYLPGVIPEKMSENDGNGKIVMLTIGADLNGKEDDARLDWEIVGWSESGASYSITHGSIGTFIPRQTKEEAESRERWTYRHGATRSVWPEFTRIVTQIYTTDTGRRMKVFTGALDAGYETDHVYKYSDSNNTPVMLVKGDVKLKYTPYQADLKKFKPSKERAGMWILESNIMKDELARHMELKWDFKSKESQPSGFMNFPQSNDGLYQYTNFFSHFEAEKRVMQTDKSGRPSGTRWEKKDSSVQNHLFDCRLYNMAAREIITEKIGRELKVKGDYWKHFCDAVMGRFEG